MMRPACTCAGTAPGYPQHESYCGQPELDDDDPRAELDDEDIAEERLRARDYEAWANL